MTTERTPIRWLLLILLLGALLLGRWHEAGPPPRDAQAPADQFSAARAQGLLEQIARAPHPVGSEEHARVQQLLIERLRALGLQPELQRTIGIAASVRKRSEAVAVVQNIVARRPGSPGGGKALLLVAHYDSVHTGPGAGDDGASVAALLETLRALQAGPPLANDLIVLFSDAEELGLLGAQAFVAEHPWAKQVGLVLNFEYRGNRGPLVMFETSPGNGALVTGLAQAVAHPIANSLMYEIYQRLPNDTDLSVFKRAGLAGMNFAAIEGHLAYHSALDTPANFSASTLQQQGDLLLALSRHFGKAPLDALQSPDRVYFDFAGLGLVHYPLAAMWGLLGLCVLGLLMAWRANAPRPLAALGGLLTASAGLPLAGALAYGLWQLLLIRHPQYRLTPQGATYNDGWYLAGFALLAIALQCAWQGLWSRWLRPTEQAAGAWLLWLLLLAGTAFALPGASFVFCWPLLSALLAAAAPARWRLPLQGLAAALAVLMFTPLVRSVFIGLTVQQVHLPIAILALLLALIGPALLDGRLLRWLGAAALLASLAAFGLAERESGFDAAHPRPSNLFFAQDADSDKAWWLSSQAEPDAWTAGFLKGHQRGPVPELFGDSPTPFLRAPATRLPELPAPRIEVLSDQTLKDRRLLKLRLQSPRAAQGLLLAVDGPAVLAARVAGRPFTIGPAPDWQLAAHGFGAQPLEVELELPAGQPATLRLRDRSFGLPLGGHSPRGADLLVQAFGGSDTLQVVTALKLP